MLCQYVVYKYGSHFEFENGHSFKKKKNYYLKLKGKYGNRRQFMITVRNNVLLVVGCNSVFWGTDA